MGLPTEERAALDAFVRRLLLILVIGVAAAAAWMLTDVLLLAFGAVLVAVVLRAIAARLENISGCGERSGIWAAILLVTGVVGLVIWLFGTQMTGQLHALSDQLKSAARDLAGRFEIRSISEVIGGQNALSRLGALVTSVLAWGVTMVSAATSALLVIFGGIYLAFDPARYRMALMRLIPRSVQPKIASALDDAGIALRGWLVAQMIAMVLVGAFTATGLWLVGLPSALALGLIAGLAEFIPIAGPLLAAIPALLIASTIGQEAVLWTIVVLIVVQQVESNLVMPLLVGKSVDVPPAIGLFAIVGMSLLFGPLGLLLGFPLTIVTGVILQRFYVHEALGKEITPPASPPP